MEKEKDDKIAELQDILEELNLSHDDYIKKTEKEILLRNQKIENLQKFINDTKNSIKIIKSQQEKYLLELEEEYENEKNEMNERIKSLKKDEEIDNQKSIMNKFKNQLEEDKKENKPEKKYTSQVYYSSRGTSNKDNKIAELQDILEELNLTHDDYIKKTEKEILLRNQKIENLQKFINDTKNSINIIKSQQEK